MQKKPTAWLHAAHLLPGVEKHDIILVQVILSEVSHFCHKESARLIGAFKQTRFVKCDFFLQSGGDTEEVSGNDWLSSRFEIWAHLYVSMVVPLVTGVWSFPSQCHPEGSWFLSFHHNLLVLLRKQISYGFSHLPLVSTAALWETETQANTKREIFLWLKN